MKQYIDVVAKFKKDGNLPIPIKFRLLEGGEKLLVDVHQILGHQYIGTNRIDFECNSLSQRGNLINYTLSYYRQEGRWMYLKDEERPEHTVRP